MKQVILLSMMTMTTMYMTAQEVQATGKNTHFSHTLTTTASPSDMWRLWTDVTTWQAWDSGLQAATLEGTFGEGSKGTLIPDKGPKSSFEIIEMDSHESYTIRVGIPFGGLYIKRSLSVIEDQTAFTHEVWFTGLLKGVFGATSGKRYRYLLPEAMQKLKLIAEGR